MFKYRGRNQNGGGGTVTFGPNILGSTDWNYTLILMPAGTYTFFCVSSGGTAAQGIEAELYQLSKYTQLETVLVGGLRIEALKTTDGSGANDIVQTFDYSNNNNQDQGVLFSRPNYIGLARNDRMLASGIATGYAPGTGGYSVVASDGCIPLGGGSYTPQYFVTPGSLHPMRTTQGGHFGYNQVKVSQADGGYSVYQYKLEPNVIQDVCVVAIDKSVCDPLAPNFPGAPDPIDFSRGELRRTYVFDSGNTMLKETHYESTYVPEPIGVHGLIVKSVGSYYYATEYEIKTSRKTKSTTLEFVYDPANPSQVPIGKVTEVSFNSLEHSLETSTIVSEVTGGYQISNITKGKVLNEINKQYVPDFLALTTANTSCDPGSYVSAYQSAVNSVCTYDYNNTISNGSCNAACKFDAWQKYTYCLNEKRKDYINSKKPYADNYLGCLTTKANGATPDLKVLYDLKIRNQVDPVIESYIKRDGKFLKSSYTTYFDVGSNRTDLSPVKLESIDQDPQFSLSFTPSIGNGTSITKSGAYSTEETYSYGNGVLAGIVPRNGVQVSYLWGYNQNYPVAEIKNAPPGSVAYTSFEEPANGGGWSYTFTNNGEHKSGNKAHLLTGNTIVRNGLNSGATYTLSYWAKGGVPSVSGGVTASNDGASAGSDGWQYFEKTVTGVTSVSLSFAGAGVYLDEVKIFPKGALITTYSYNPLVGIITQTDPNGSVTSYGYDPLGRLQYTIDKDGYVVRKFEYAYRTH
ncbi:MAG: RHS repeat domain-containing protein [Bacteroidota bacterium]